MQLERIRRIEPTFHRDANVTLQDGTVLRVSRTYAVALQQALR